MISRNNSYFSPELLTAGHYLINGFINDNFIDDYLQVVDIRQLLHQELMRSDFDAVVFFDRLNRLYCFDKKSYRILTHPNDALPADNTSESIKKLRASAPRGCIRSRTRSRRGAGADNIPDSDTYNLRMVSISAAWRYLIALLRQTRSRVAVVFPNIVGLSEATAPEERIPPEAVDALSELTAQTSDRPHVAIYMYRTDPGANLDEHAEKTVAPAWRQFYNMVLRPIIETDDPVKNRVITLGPPNAAEISKLLTMMRLKKKNPLLIAPEDMYQLTQDIAYIAATGNKPLRDIRVNLDIFITSNPGVYLTHENCHKALGAKQHRTAAEEIEQLVGLANVKSWARGWVDSAKDLGMARTFPARASRLFPTQACAVKNGFLLNIVMTGKQGTGKTSLARRIGRFYYELGVLPRGHIISCSAADLVSGYVGQTAQLVHRHVMRAMGGVLFIDEAYALTKNAHGREAIDQLVNDITAYQGQFAVVICGYPTPMKAFLAANQGLSSRFATNLHLEDYSPEEMEMIFRKFVSDDGALCISEELDAALANFCDNWATDHGSEWGNAREAENLVEAMKLSALSRTAGAGRCGQMLTLTTEDIPQELRHHLRYKPRTVAEIIDTFDNPESEGYVIGLSNVKQKMHQLAKNIAWASKNVLPGRYIFHGPPGVGKTHMARLMCNLLFRLGVIRRNYVYEVTAKQLYHPDPKIDYGTEHPTISEIIEHAVEEACGGVLLIDEAHQLNDDDIGKSVIRALVPIIDRKQVRENTCIILAGYSNKMSQLLLSDSGLERRFPKTDRIRFVNYTPSELADLAEMFAGLAGHKVTEEFKERTRAAFSVYLQEACENYGNAGFIRDTYIPEAISRKNARLSSMRMGDASHIPSRETALELEAETRCLLTGADLPIPFDIYAGPENLPAPPELTVWQRVDSLIGKEEVKEYLSTRNPAATASRRRFSDSAVSAGSHFAIVGPAGCGRHTTARLIASVLSEIGVIDRPEVHLVGKASLEGEFLGHTVPKTISEIETASGGCMLVEYPSSMLDSGTSNVSYGEEALSTLSGAMSGWDSPLSMIFIDSEDGFEALSKRMPELVGKLTRVFRLTDLSPSEMYELFLRKTGNSHKFEPALKELIPDFFVNWVSRRGDLGENTGIWSNGKEVEKLIQELNDRWSKFGGIEDTADEDRVPRRMITRNMFPQHLAKYLKRTSVCRDTALEMLDNLTGLEGVKRAVHAIKRKFEFSDRDIPPGFYAFLGEPGVGKTMTANLFGGVLNGAGVLSQGHVICRTAKQLSEEYARDTKSFEKILRLAKNGILFIDEAHTLCESAAGKALIKKLLTTVEDTETMKDLCIILAGYEDAMQLLFAEDIGFSSRFERDNSVIRFEDYTTDQLMQIMDSFAAKADTDEYLNHPCPLDVSDAQFRAATRRVFELERGRPNFGNARFVRNYLDKCINKLLERVAAVDMELKHKKHRAMLSRLTVADVPYDLERLPGKCGKSAISADLLPPMPEYSPEDIFAAESISRINQSVVLLECVYADGNRGTGSGCIITREGHVLTCAHVIDNALSVRAKVYTPGSIGGNWRYFDCSILHPTFPAADMALIKLSGSNFMPLPLRPADHPAEMTEKILVPGYPLGDTLSAGDTDSLNMSVYRGSISSVQSGAGRADVYCIDCVGKHGNSGSPVISQRDGRILGVFFGALTDHEGRRSADESLRQNSFFPIKYFWDFFVEHKEENTDGK